MLKAGSLIRGVTMSCFLAHTVWAQDDGACVALLQHGIYDYTRAESNFRSASDVRAKICTAYSQLKAGSLTAKAEADVIGIFGGSANYTQQSLEVVGQAMCSDNSDVSSIIKNISLIQRTVSPEGAAAFQQCLSLNAAGLKAQTTFREEDQGEMTIELRYVAPPGAPPQLTVADVVIQPDSSFTCRGPLNVTQGTLKVGTETVGMSCARRIASSPFTFNGRQVLAKPATVTVLTTSGTITRSMAAIYAAPPPTPLVIPVGTVLAFSGTMHEAEAQEQFGWWVADGRTISDPQSSLNGTTTPDLRSHFLMGSDTVRQNGGSASFAIPDQVVHSHTNGQFGPPMIYGDPFTHMQGSHGWTTDAAIYSEGTWSGLKVPTLPPYFTVVYLVKVK